MRIVITKKSILMLFWLFILEPCLHHIALATSHTDTPSLIVPASSDSSISLTSSIPHNNLTNHNTTIDNEDRERHIDYLRNIGVSVPNDYTGPLAFVRPHKITATAIANSLRAEMQKTHNIYQANLNLDANQKFLITIIAKLKAVLMEKTAPNQPNSITLYSLANIFSEIRQLFAASNLSSINLNLTAETNICRQEGGDPAAVIIDFQTFLAANQFYYQHNQEWAVVERRLGKLKLADIVPADDATNLILEEILNELDYLIRKSLILSQVVLASKDRKDKVLLLAQRYILISQLTDARVVEYIDNHSSEFIADLNEYLANNLKLISHLLVTKRIFAYLERIDKESQANEALKCLNKALHTLECAYKDFATYFHARPLKTHGAPYLTSEIDFIIREIPYIKDIKDLTESLKTFRARLATEKAKIEGKSNQAIPAAKIKNKNHPTKGKNSHRHWKHHSNKNKVASKSCVAPPPSATAINHEEEYAPDHPAEDKVLELNHATDTTTKSSNNLEVSVNEAGSASLEHSLEMEDGEFVAAFVAVFDEINAGIEQLNEQIEQFRKKKLEQKFQKKIAAPHSVLAETSAASSSASPVVPIDQRLKERLKELFAHPPHNKLTREEVENILKKLGGGELRGNGHGSKFQVIFQGRSRGLIKIGHEGDNQGKLDKYNVLLLINYLKKAALLGYIAPEALPDDWQLSSAELGFKLA